MFAIKKVEKLTKINNNNKSFIELDCSASIKEYCKFMAQAGEVAKKKEEEAEEGDRTVFQYGPDARFTTPNRSW